MTLKSRVRLQITTGGYRTENGQATSTEFIAEIRRVRLDVFDVCEFLNQIRTVCLTIFCPTTSSTSCYLQSINRSICGKRNLWTVMLLCGLLSDHTLAWMLIVFIRNMLVYFNSARVRLYSTQYTDTRNANFINLTLLRNMQTFPSILVA